ncbi:insulinase family protein [bacterium]|nr:insulinase family protein [bacterium]
MNKLSALLLLCLLDIAGAQPIPDRPEALQFPKLSWQPPRFERVELPGGAVLYLVENHELPLVRGKIMFLGGAAHEPAERAGLSALTMHVLRTGGTAEMSAEELDEALEFVAASIETSADADRSTLSFDCLSKDFDDVWAMLVDMLEHPRFQERYIDEKKKQMLEALRRENDQPEQILMREYRRLLYPDHPYGRRTDGEEKTIAALSRDDLLAWHKQLLSPSRMLVGVAGDFDARDIKRRVRQLAENWPYRTVALPAVPPLPQPKEGLFIFEKPIAQTSLILAHRGPARPYPDYHAVQVMSFILGGGSFSRLTDSVRTKGGLAYGVASFFAYGYKRGVFGAWCQTKPTTSYRAGELILSEIERIRRGRRPPRAATGQRLAGQCFIFRSGSLTSTWAISRSWRCTARVQFLDDYMDRIQRVTAADVRRVAEKYLHPDRLLMLYVGDSWPLRPTPARLPTGRDRGET